MKRLAVLVAAIAAVVAIFGTTIVYPQLFSARYSSTSELCCFISVAIVASLLCLTALILAPRSRDKGKVAPFVFGFEVAGWTQLFAFMTCYAIAPDSIGDYLQAVEAILAPCLPESLPAAFAALENLPIPVLDSADFLIEAALAALPAVLIAVLAGWLTHLAGLTVRFERRCVQGAGAPAERAAPSARPARATHAVQVVTKTGAGSAGSLIQGRPS
jgi:hypothetical protein